MKRVFCLVTALVVLTSNLSAKTGQKEPAKEFTNSVGMKFVWIPPGRFLMGSPNEEFRRNQDETQHKVTLTKGFYLGVYTVTQDQWRAVMGNNPSYHKGDKNLPVEWVSWYDCQKFLEALSKKEGSCYRLPTEAEWEYACRAGTTSPFYCGDNITSDFQANYNGDYPYIKGIGRARNNTTPVGGFPANSWGLCDMHGNVLQWCADLYKEYPTHEDFDPQSPEALAQLLESVSTHIIQLHSPTYSERQAATKALKEIGLPALPALRTAAEDGPDLETQRRVGQLIATISKQKECRVLRGGSFNSPAAHVRSAYRFKYEPMESYFSVGFRVAMTFSTR